MAFDFKREYREFYMPKQTPGIVTVPPMRYVAVRGEGNPNASDGPYQRAIAVLYAVAYTLKMSKLGDHRIEGYFDFVVPPLEGFWWQPGVEGVDCRRKDDFHWISCIRLPDFVTEMDMKWAANEAAAKKKLDCASAEFLAVEEGLCAQLLHVGPFDEEPASVARLDAFVREQGCAPDFSETRLHHEIYLSDARKAPPEKWKTVIRHPIRRI